MNDKRRVPREVEICPVCGGKGYVRRMIGKSQDAETILCPACRPPADKVSSK